MESARRFGISPRGTAWGATRSASCSERAGWGGVYCALDPTLDREVAIKALAGTFLGNPPACGVSSARRASSPR